MTRSRFGAPGEASTRRRLTDEDVERIRAIGRDERRRIASIGITELDDLCDEILARGRELDAALRSAEAARADARVATLKRLEADARADAIARAMSTAGGEDLAPGS